MAILKIIGIIFFQHIGINVLENENKIIAKYGESKTGQNGQTLFKSLPSLQNEI